MANAAIPMEWFFETLNKRLSQGIKLEDLFLCVPYNEECEFDFEIPNVFKQTKNGIITSGNNLAESYPFLAKLVKNSNKTIKIKVFFVHTSRLLSVLLLHHKKYPYPKVNKVKGNFILSEHDVRKELSRQNVINQLKAKYN